ncbi:MAG: sulfotransferase family protein [Limisphaerales bacterium]
MISHRYQCLFIEVPKTGSSSIRALLGPSPRPHRSLWQTKYDLENYWTYYSGTGNRILASLYLLLPERTRQRIASNIFNTYFKFGFVRNPWDRVVSLYERREGLQLREKMSFTEFAHWIQLSSSTCIHPLPHRNQLDWFVDPHGNVCADFIGRFENLAKDWAIIGARLGIRLPLPHANCNPRRTRHYTEYYTPTTRQIIADRFRVDIEFFGYEFEGNSRLPAGAGWREGALAA